MTDPLPPLPAPLPVLFVDCFSGVSGDMLLGGLVDLGLPLERLRAGLARLPIQGWRLEAEPKTSRGLTGTRLSVRADERGQPERHLAEILSLIERSGLPRSVQERAAAVFRRLGRVEARIHGVSLDEVHFHEVGALDSIIDVVGIAIGLDALGVERVYASSLPLAQGTVQTRHGPLPLPAPATLELLAEVGAPTRPAPGQVELVTPTGAAFLAEVATWEQPPMRVRRVGYGFGARELAWPNVVRLWLGEPARSDAAPDLGGPGTLGDLARDEVMVIETNLDDAPPELLGYAMERLFEAGALDVSFTPIQMKKNRPGVLLGVIAPPERLEPLSEVILAETPSLGVRFQRMARLVTERRVETLQTPLGALRVKLKRIGGRWTAAPEYEDCARLARAHGTPLAEVYRLALAAAEDLAPR